MAVKLKLLSAIRQNLLHHFSWIDFKQQIRWDAFWDERFNSSKKSLASFDIALYFKRLLCWQKCSNIFLLINVINNSALVFSRFLLSIRSTNTSLRLVAKRWPSCKHLLYTDASRRVDDDRATGGLKSFSEHIPLPYRETQNSLWQMTFKWHNSREGCFSKCKGHLMHGWLKILTRVEEQESNDEPTWRLLNTYHSVKKVLQISSVFAA